MQLGNFPADKLAQSDLLKAPFHTLVGQLHLNDIICVWDCGKPEYRCTIAIVYAGMDEMYIGIVYAGMDEMYIWIVYAGMDEMYIGIVYVGMDEMYIWIVYAGMDEMYIGIVLVWICLPPIPPCHSTPLVAMNN